MLLGKKSSTPPNAPNQHKFYPRNCNYQFDNKIYKGIEAAPAIEKLVKSFCPGCRLYKQRKYTNTKGGVTWTYDCYHYPTVSLKSADNFVPGKITKVGAINKNVKGRRWTKKEDGNTSFKRMVNLKIKPKQTKQRRRHAVDRRGKNTCYMKDNSKTPSTKRTVGVRSQDVDEKCLMNIK